jgi:hypothetical protein
MAKKIVEIKSCFDEKYWYKDFINEKFEVKFIDETNNYYVVDMCNDRKELGSVNPEDCIELEVDDAVVVRECIYQPNEIDYMLELDYRLSKIELGI